MASKVDILIKAKDEASGVIDGVKESFGELEGGADDLKENGSKSFGDFMDNVAIAMLGINQAIEVGMKIAEAAKIVYDKTVGKALAIATEVETLSRISGDAPENISALRIAAEESKVPFDDLYKAMENLNKNGIPPTVENLVAIADEYVALKDPIEKATLLTENFGTAGDEIAPMLEAIAGGVKNVQDGMPLFTEEDIQNANDYTEALVDFNIAKEGFLVKLGQTFLPSLTEVLQNLSGAPTEMAKLYDDVISALDKALVTGAIKWDTYKFILNDVNSVTGTYSEHVDKLTTHLGILSDMTGDVADETDNMNQVLEDNAKLLEDLEGAQLKYNIAVEVFKTDIAGQLYQGLVDAGLSQQQMEESLGALDSFFGTSYTVKYKMEAELDDLLQQLIDNPEAFAPAAQSFVDTFAPLQESAINAQKEIKKIADEIANIPGVVDIEFNITVNGSLPNVGGGRPRPGHNPVGQSTQAAGGMVQAAASGLAASLPYYWVGERGPEPFFPSVDGRIVSNTQAMSALRGGAGANAREIANAVKQGVKEAMRDTGGGKTFNLTMPTSSNPADVRTAFELMEAWA